jgi:peptide/nickel transport system substrate-binding protein
MLLNNSPGGNCGCPWEFMGADATSAQVCYENLLKGLQDGTYEPWLATDYEYSADKLSATYSIRQGVKFHDGTDLNAEAVKYNLDQFMAANKTPYWEDVEVLDEYTIKIYFTEYRNDNLVSPGTWQIASPTAAQKDGSLDYLRKHPVGTGPFEFVSYQQDQTFIAKKFDGYWHEGLPYLDEVKWIYAPEPMTQKAAMQSGEADTVPAELGKLAADFRDLGLRTMIQHQAVFTIFFDSANENSPFHDQKVREAVEYAINREEIAEGLGYGLMIPIKNCIPYDNAAYTDDIPYRPYDPDKASQLLDEAGYPDGFQTVLYPHVNGDKDINLAIKQYLDDVGIQTSLEYIPNTQYMEKMMVGWEGMLLGPMAGFANYVGSISMYLGQTSVFHPSVDKPDELQAIIDAIYVSENYPDIPLIQEAITYIAEHAVCVPVHDGGMGFAFGDRVRGIEDAYLTMSFPPWFMSEIVWLDD